MFPRGYALIMGVGEYLHFQSLPQTVPQDACDLAELLRNPDLCSYPKENVRLFTDEQATVTAMWQGLQWLAEKTGPGETAVIYFSGHGGRIESGPAAGNYLLLHDSHPQNLRQTAVISDALSERLRRIRA